MSNILQDNMGANNFGVRRLKKCKISTIYYAYCCAGKDIIGNGLNWRYAFFGSESYKNAVLREKMVKTIN